MDGRPFIPPNRETMSSTCFFWDTAFKTYRTGIVLELQSTKGKAFHKSLKLTEWSCSSFTAPRTELPKQGSPSIRIMSWSITLSPLETVPIAVATICHVQKRFAYKISTDLTNIWHLDCERGEKGLVVSGMSVCGGGGTSTQNSRARWHSVVKIGGMGTSEAPCQNQKNPLNVVGWTQRRSCNDSHPAFAERPTMRSILSVYSAFAYQHFNLKTTLQTKICTNYPNVN